MVVEDWLGTDNALGIDIWNRKYKFENESFDDWVDRVCAGNNNIKNRILNKQFLFGGRILANRGLDKLGYKVSLSNCYVLEPPEDNLESIFETAKKLARTYSYGGGCGVDISKLAPKGAMVHNTAKKSSGATSFMDLYSMVTGLIGQNGRRGALMLSMSCEHPDIEEFITIKSNLDRITKANISVRITDKFMNAVKNNEEITLSFERPETLEKIEKIVNAKDVFMLLSKMNWDYAEPGVLFWDKIEKWNLLENNADFKFAGTNPCAEEPLPAGGSCCLGSINLDAFVNNGCFNYSEFLLCVDDCIVALNEVLDEGLNLHPLQEQRDSVSTLRQIGLGIMGLADALIHLGIKYGSKESIDFCDKLGLIMAQESILQSNKLGEKYGAYSLSNLMENKTEYFRLNQPTGIECLRLRNSQILTIAPTGTLSTMLGISGGIEPIFANYYERKTESLYGEERVYKVYTPIVKKYMEDNNIKNDYNLPDYFITSQNLNYRDRINMQSIWQKHIDASISSTVNVPNEFTIEQVADLYMYAWEMGLKGITIFRDGCKRAGVLISNTEEKKNKNEDKDNNQLLPRGYIEDVPENITYKKFKLTTGCGKLYLFVGIDTVNNRICDFFTNTDSVGGCTINTQAVSRLMSASIRGGVSVEYVIEQLQKSGTCPAYQYARGSGKEVSKGKSCASAIANVLKDIIEEIKIDQHKDSLTFKKLDKQALRECPSCHSTEMAFEGGCVICKACGYSKCD